MTIRCEVCGREFEPYNKRQKFCDKDCAKAHKLEYLCEYRKRADVMERHREKNKSFMRQAREEEKKRKAEKEAKEARFVSLNYAERQIAQTLALAGKVSTSL